MPLVEEAPCRGVRVGEGGEGCLQPVAVVLVRVPPEVLLVPVLGLQQPLAGTGQPGVRDQPVVLTEPDEDAGQDPGGGDLHQASVEPGHETVAVRSVRNHGALVLSRQRPAERLLPRPLPEVVLQQRDLLLQLLEQVLEHRLAVLRRTRRRTGFLRRHRRNLFPSPTSLPRAHGVSIHPASPAARSGSQRPEPRLLDAPPRPGTRARGDPYTSGRSRPPTHRGDVTTSRPSARRSAGADARDAVARADEAEFVGLRLPGAVRHRWAQARPTTLTRPPEEPAHHPLNA